MEVTGVGRDRAKNLIPEDGTLNAVLNTGHPDYPTIPEAPEGAMLEELTEQFPQVDDGVVFVREGMAEEYVDNDLLDALDTLSIDGIDALDDDQLKLLRQHAERIIAEQKVQNGVPESDIGIQWLRQWREAFLEREIDNEQR